MASAATARAPCRAEGRFLKWSRWSLVRRPIHLEGTVTKTPRMGPHRCEQAGRPVDDRRRDPEHAAQARLYEEFPAAGCRNSLLQGRVNEEYERSFADPRLGVTGRFEAKRRYESNPINRAPIVTPVQSAIEESPTTFGQKGPRRASSASVILRRRVNVKMSPRRRPSIFHQKKGL